MIDTSIRARLRRLFSTQVIVRKVGANKIKVTDTSKLQAGGNPYGSTYVDRFAGLHTNRTMGVTGIGNAYSFHAVKTQLYTDYEAMDLDPIISSALDIYADESTTYSENNIVLEIKTEDARIQKILHNLFYDVLNVEYNLWPWVRNMCKYGDFYLYLDINEELGVVNVMPISAYELERQEGYDPENPYSVRFTFIGKNSVYSSNEKNTHFEYYEIAHFRMLSDTNFLPYGKSMIEGARKLFKQLVLMEDAMLLQRIMRAPERRIFKIDVGNIPPNEVDSHIQNIITKVKKVPYMDPQSGEYNLKFNMQNMLEDFYLPVRGSESGTSIETLPGLSSDGQIEDIEYLRNKMMAALKIPKAFLGYDEGIQGKSTLAAEDVRFARTIERIQRIVISELYKIAVVHLYTQGFEDADLVNFELNLTSPSIIYERQKVELMKEKIDLANTLIESKLFSRKFIYENIFDMDQNGWENEQELVVEDTKQEFRLEQIKSEGNDPKLTKQSYGTPHDIASMHVSSKYEDPRLREYVPGPGRPNAKTNFESDRDVDGPDPIGMKDVSDTFKVDTGMTKTPKTSSAFGENTKYIGSILHSMKQNKLAKSTSVAQTLNEHVEPSDTGTLLDESRLDSFNV